MTDPASCIDQLFRNARSHNAWLDKPVSDDVLHQLYEVAKWGPIIKASGAHID